MDWQDELACTQARVHEGPRVGRVGALLRAAEHGVRDGAVLRRDELVHEQRRRAEHFQRGRAGNAHDERAGLVRWKVEPARVDIVHWHSRSCAQVVQRPDTSHGEVGAPSGRGSDVVDGARDSAFENSKAVSRSCARPACVGCKDGRGAWHIPWGDALDPNLKMLRRLDKIAECWEFGRRYWLSDCRGGPSPLQGIDWSSVLRAH